MYKRIDLTVDEMNERRLKLETLLATAIQEFTSQTGLVVKKAGICTWDDSDNKVLRVSVGIEITLPDFWTEDIIPF